MKKYISAEELEARIKLNAERLNESYYRIENVFQEPEADWPGDKEGRALLAFVSHYKINGTRIECMDLLMDKIPEATGGKLFFGPEAGEVLYEQQLSGHSWYLRGLCEYYEQFADERAKKYMTATVEKLYLPTKGHFESYPTERENSDGGVSGHSGDVINGWRLSSDIGCAFMSLDGLSHYYKVTKDERARELIEEMSVRFDKIDKFALQAQTHCTLTAARGFMRMYEETDDAAYLSRAKTVFDLYVKRGMTYTYQNFNWFAKGDTWTEPCAIVDSLMLAVMLYKKTGDESARKYAARIYFNGFATAQRPNGGAGTDSTVSETCHSLYAKMYEAYFCCTMRLSEGLWFINENRELLYAEVEGTVKKDEVGRFTDGDLIYAEPAAESVKYADSAEKRVCDGITLYPLIKFYKLKDENECREVVQKVIF